MVTFCTPAGWGDICMESNKCKQVLLFALYLRYSLRLSIRDQSIDYGVELCISCVHFKIFKMKLINDLRIYFILFRCKLISEYNRKYCIFYWRNIYNCNFLKIWFTNANDPYTLLTVICKQIHSLIAEWK